ncbi:GDYXXLXY domain-containing protein [Winogradskyella sp. J14-2]|uniref:GDYXXLXY domain-containing protein n=1 Tax=Winogradskyella sp. J14-2 TaxID=1936080 RepID=UPI0009F92016|nr:GDYXXLXY domain-containing protein [Winogradskyella sp. J14-2]
MKTIHIFILFVVVAVIQLYVPAKMILDREDVLKTGITYKFKTRPVDPNDPFRGKYITLNYEMNSAKTNDSIWKRGETIFVYLENDSLGYAKVHSVSKEKKDIDRDYVETKVRWNYGNSNTVNFELPFDRFYMEETKAKPAEDIYRKYNRRRDTLNQTYALVAIKNGKAVLKDVYINDKPIAYYLEIEDEN